MGPAVRLRACSYAASSVANATRVGRRPPKHSRVRMLNSISAMFNQLPCACSGCRARAGFGWPAGRRHRRATASARRSRVCTAARSRRGAASRGAVRNRRRRSPRRPVGFHSPPAPPGRASRRGVAGPGRGVVIGIGRPSGLLASHARRSRWHSVGLNELVSYRLVSKILVYVPLEELDVGGGRASSMRRGPSRRSIVSFATDGPLPASGPRSPIKRCNSLGMQHAPRCAVYFGPGMSQIHPSQPRRPRTRSNQMAGSREFRACRTEVRRYHVSCAFGHTRRRSV